HHSTHVAAEVRAALAPFRAVCAQAGLYGLAVIHPRKGTQGTIEESISGSGAFYEVTRGCYHIYKDPADESQNPVRLLTCSKASYLSFIPPTLRFRIVSWDEERGMPCDCHYRDCGHEGRIVWENNLIDDRSAEQIWKQIVEKGKVRHDVAVMEAEAFLESLMEANGIINRTPEQIMALAAKEFITQAAIKRAKAN